MRTVTITILEPPWELETPRGVAYALVLIDYSQESFTYFLTTAKDTGDFWIYRNDRVQLRWNESTGLGKKPAEGPTTIASAKCVNPAGSVGSGIGYVAQPMWHPPEYQKDGSKSGL